MSDSRRRRLHGPIRAALPIAMLMVALAGCSSVRSFMDPASIEYRGATSGPGLDVPPDLVTPQGTDRYSVPSGRSARSQTLSDFNRARANQDAAPRDTTVLPATREARIERDGNLRWIVVDEPAEALWPKLKDFWITQGFDLATDEPAIGIMETAWAERRQRVETDGLRGVLSRVLGSSYATGERDRYRTRLERLPGGGTEIYVTHRGMEEVLTGVQKDGSMWQPRPQNPELEVEYLRRMLTALGRVPAQPAAMASAAAPVQSDAAPAARTRLVTDGDVASIVLNEGFDRAWREVGLVLDRVGFTVEDRDRSKGVYFVRYVDLDRRDPKQGAISRFFSGERKDLAGQRYQITVRNNGANAASIGVQDVAGSPAGANPAASGEAAATAAADNRRVANRIVALLNDELK